MIVDCHTHVWQSPDQLGPAGLGGTGLGRQRIPRVPAADPDHHWQESAGTVDKSIILGFKSRYLHAEIPNRFLADYVRRDPERLIGFAGIDPTDDHAADELASARDDLRLRGLTLSPADQDYHPLDSRVMRVYDEAEREGMPIVFHPAGQYARESKLEHARPYLLDEVARSFPTLRFVIPSLGYPWVDETITLLAKHPGCFADVSGLLQRPWAAYDALVRVYQAGVIDKVLFGSDFPYTRASECIETLYRLNQTVQGTNLPVVPREALRGIVERDTLTLLGIS